MEKKNLISILTLLFLFPFYSAPKSGLCLYGDEQFKNQYEAWRFSDSGEILSHRVFRDDREYEEYLKTIYKTEDSKNKRTIWQFSTVKNL